MGGANTPGIMAPLTKESGKTMKQMGKEFSYSKERYLKEPSKAMSSSMAGSPPVMGWRFTRGNSKTINMKVKGSSLKKGNTPTKVGL